MVEKVMVQAFNAKVHFFTYAIFTFKVLMRALGCSSWSLYHTLAVRSLEVEKTRSSVTKILQQQLTNFGFELNKNYFTIQNIFHPNCDTHLCIFPVCPL